MNHRPSSAYPIHSNYYADLGFKSSRRMLRENVFTTGRLDNNNLREAQGHIHTLNTIHTTIGISMEIASYGGTECTANKGIPRENTSTTSSLDAVTFKRTHLNTRDMATRLSMAMNPATSLTTQSTTSRNMNNASSMATSTNSLPPAWA